MDRLTEAKSPDTSPERLAELANDFLYDVRQAVAEHSSTTSELLQN